MEMYKFLYQNYGAFFDLVGAGITGPVKLMGKNGTTVDLSSQQWTYQASLVLHTLSSLKYMDISSPFLYMLYCECRLDFKVKT